MCVLEYSASCQIYQTDSLKSESRAVHPVRNLTKARIKAWKLFICLVCISYDNL
jgi:hypothetical protein